jgi:hypothetical protein
MPKTSKSTKRRTKKKAADSRAFPRSKSRFSRTRPASSQKKKRAKKYVTAKVRNPKTKTIKTRAITKKRLDDYYVYNEGAGVYYKKHRVLTRKDITQKEYNAEAKAGLHRLYYIHASYLASYQGATLGEFTATGNFYEASDRGLESGLDLCERQVYSQIRAKYGFATGVEITLLNYEAGYRKEYLLQENGRWKRRLDENNNEER